MTILAWYVVNVVVNFALFFVEAILHAKKTEKTLRRELLGEVFAIKDILMYCVFTIFLLLPIIPTVFILAFISDYLRIGEKVSKFLNKPLITTK